MDFLRKLRVLFRRESSGHMHPRRKGDELIVCQRMEKILRERDATSKPFHVKYIGCTGIDSPTLDAERASEVARAIIRGGPRSNKRRVSLIITSKEIFVTDTMSRCGLTSFPMGEIGMVFAPPENCRLFGVTVKDNTTAGFTFFLYKCTVTLSCFENVELMKEYETMHEEYLRTESELIHDVDVNNTPDTNNAVVTLEEENESKEEKTSVESADHCSSGEDGEEGEDDEMTDDEGVEDKDSVMNRENEGNLYTEGEDMDEKNDNSSTPSMSEKEEVETEEEDDDGGKQCDEEGANGVGDSDDEREEEAGEESREDEECTAGAGDILGASEERDTTEVAYDCYEESDEDEDGNGCNKGEDPDKESGDETDDKNGDTDPDVSEDTMSQSPRPTRSGFTYLSFTPSLSDPATPEPHTPSSSPQPPQYASVDLDEPCSSRPQPPRKRVSPYILNLIKQIEASLIEPRHDSDESDEETMT